MCNTNPFFSILLCYFVFLLNFTILRKFIGYKGIFFMFTGLLSVFTGYLVCLFNDVVLLNSTSEFLWSFNSINWLSLELALSLRLDGLSYLFVILVTIIGLGTNFYILNYLKYEAHEDLFSLLINWFMFSMIILILSNNLFTLFLGWESIGLSSFFLINFWSTRRGTVKSSFKAFFFNKISDVFLFIFLVNIQFIIHTNTISIINLKTSLVFLPTNTTIYFACLCLFTCTLFKSAQLFGHLWLPDSMEAPVPASALIHSATLVSAGVYLLLRFTPLITLNNLQLLATIVGSVTAAYGGLVSAAQTDMKKLLAYSTISHCGFLFVAIGTEIYTTVIIYLFLHGLFKALTFFCVGSFIRVAGSQDTRQMGALNRLLPVDTIFLIICAFNLGGLPFSLGYLYKSVLISSLLVTNTTPFIVGFSTIGLLTSVLYVYRLVYYSAFDTAKELFSHLIYELQQKQVNVVKNWSLTTIVQIIAMIIVLIFTLWIYLYFINYFLKSELTLDHFPIILNCNIQFISNCNLFYKSFFEIFYTIYVLIIYVVTVVSWRIEYSYQFKLNFLLNATLTLLFSIIFMSLKCGVMFWLKRLHNKTSILVFQPINLKS